MRVDRDGQSNLHRISCNCSGVNQTEVVDSTVKNASLSKETKTLRFSSVKTSDFRHQLLTSTSLSILRQLHGQASKSSAKFADDRLQSSMSSKRACTQKCFLWTAQLCFATVLAPQSAGKNNILRRAQVGILTMQQIAMGRPPVCIRNQHVDTVVDFDSLFQNLVLHPTILLSSTGWRQLPPARSVANSIANQCHHGIYMSTRMCMRKHTKASVRIAYITFASVHLNCAFLGEKREKCALPASQEQNSPKGISSSRSHCPLAEPGKLGSGS